MTISIKLTLHQALYLKALLQNPPGYPDSDESQSAASARADVFEALPSFSELARLDQMECAMSASTCGFFKNTEAVWTRELPTTDEQPPS